MSWMDGNVWRKIGYGRYEIVLVVNLTGQVEVMERALHVGSSRCDVVAWINGEVGRKLDLYLIAL